MLLGDIVQALGGELHGNPALTITGLAPLGQAVNGQISFLSHARYGAALASTGASAVILRADALASARQGCSCIVTEDPYVYFARLTQLWRQRHGRPVSVGVHPTAVVDPSASVDASAFVGPLCVIGPGASVGPGTRLVAQVHLGADCHVGSRCILHPGVVLGADGFGFAQEGGAWIKIEQLGGVRVGNDVEIGANSCVDRGAMADTVIDDGVKIDNLVQIGHNVHIGAHSALAGCVGVAGSARIGAHCTIGGGAVVLGHLELADHVHVSAASVVTRSLLKPGHYSGVFPIDDNSEWERNAATLRQLHSLRERLRALERSLKT